MYDAQDAIDQIEAAQLALDTHPRLQDGRCGGCGVYSCRTYADAQAVFARHGRLPRRHTGSTTLQPG